MAHAADASHTAADGSGTASPTRAQRGIRHCPALVERTAARVGRAGTALALGGGCCARTRRDWRVEPQRCTAGELAGVAARRRSCHACRQACCQRPHRVARRRGRTAAMAATHRPRPTAVVARRLECRQQRCAARSAVATCPAAGAAAAHGSAAGRCT
ncbi:hypothetical protein G6F63_015174 [Rhizopus arrhizus]|nr:hypothetical protein G6F63_015174 [Rhizopus arrhizus]